MRREGRWRPRRPGWVRRPGRVRRVRRSDRRRRVRWPGGVRRQWWRRWRGRLLRVRRVAARGALQQRHVWLALHEVQPARQPAQRRRVQITEEVKVALRVVHLPVQAGELDAQVGARLPLQLRAGDALVEAVLPTQQPHVDAVADQGHPQAARVEVLRRGHAMGARPAVLLQAPEALVDPLRDERLVVVAQLVLELPARAVELRLREGGVVARRRRGRRERERRGRALVAGAADLEGALGRPAVELHLVEARVGVRVETGVERVVVAVWDALVVLGRGGERLHLPALVAAGAAVKLAPRVPGALEAVGAKHARVQASEAVVGAPGGAHARLVLKERRAAHELGAHLHLRRQRGRRRRRGLRRREALVAAAAAVEAAAHLP